MNKTIHRDRRRRSGSPISSWILRRLAGVPGLAVTADGQRARLGVRVAHGRKITFDVHEERTVSEERARALAAAIAQTGARTLVATMRLAPRARAALRNADLSWIERDTGRYRLSGPGMLVDVDPGLDLEREGRPIRGSRPAKRPPALLRHKSGLVAEALLLHWHQRPITLSEVAVSAGLSRALVSRLLARLTALNILVAHGRAPRKHWMLDDPGALLDLWFDEERMEPEEVTAINVWSRTSRELLDRVGQLGDANLRYALSGTAAANLYAPTLTVDPIADIWIPAETQPTHVAGLLGGEVVESGANARLFQRSGDTALRYAERFPAAKRTGSGTFVVSPFRAYIEARHRGGRGPEVAAALRSAFPFGSQGRKPSTHA